MSQTCTSRKSLQTINNSHLGGDNKATTVRFYRIRSNVNPLLGSTITRSKVIASTLLMSTQNDLHQNWFYIINVYRS